MLLVFLQNILKFVWNEKKSLANIMRTHLFLNYEYHANEYRISPRGDAGKVTYWGEISSFELPIYSCTKTFEKSNEYIN